MPINPTLGKLKQRDSKFGTYLDYIARPLSGGKKKKKKKFFFETRISLCYTDWYNIGIT
jgi:hypothetical protein